MVLDPAPGDPAEVDLLRGPQVLVEVEFRVHRSLISSETARLRRTVSRARGSAAASLRSSLLPPRGPLSGQGCKGFAMPGQVDQRISGRSPYLCDIPKRGDSVLSPPAVASATA